MKLPVEPGLRPGRSARTLCREDAVATLARHSIRGAHVYLIDVIPLLAMLWADGIAQKAEVQLLEIFVQQHVDNINKLAATEVLSPDQGSAFLHRFLDERPSPDLLRTLARLIPPVRLNTSDPELNRWTRQEILDWCLDIGAACAAHYPHGDRERFDVQEKECFFEVFRNLGGLD